MEREPAWERVDVNAILVVLFDIRALLAELVEGGEDDAEDDA